MIKSNSDDVMCRTKARVGFGVNVKVTTGNNTLFIEGVDFGDALH